MTSRPPPPVAFGPFLPALIVACAATWVAAGPSIRPLDFAPGAVSADGRVVVGARDGAAVRWTETGGTVGLPSDLRVRGVSGVSADGSVVVGTLEPLEPFRWTAEGGMTRLGHPPGYGHSAANGVSADGSVIVGHGTGFGQASEAFRWTVAGGYERLGGNGHPHGSRAHAVSPDGSVVVGVTGDSLFRWTAGRGMAALPQSEESYGYHRWRFYDATGVSADGNVVVGNAYERFEEGDPFDISVSGFAPLRWSADDMRDPESGEGGDVFGLTGLRLLAVGYGDHQESRATGVSADASVVVGVAWGRRNYPFVWEEANGMRDLRDLLSDAGVDLTGWRTIEPSGLSADGMTIVGTGLDAAGRTSGWIVTIPEPTALLPLVAFGALTLSARRRRRFRLCIIPALSVAPSAIGSTTAAAQPSIRAWTFTRRRTRCWASRANGQRR